MEVIASEFARMAGVSAMAISKKIANGTLIRNSAKKIDTDNPVNRAYLERRQAKARERLRLRVLEDDLAAPVAANDAASAPNDGVRRLSAVEMLRMPLGQLVRNFGVVDNVEKYSKILRDLSTADEREQKTQERRLIQIPKDFVVQRLFGYVDQLMYRLLDVPEAVCDQVMAITLAGGAEARTGVQRVLSDSISRCISGAKEHVVGELEALRGKYDSDRAAELRVEDLVSAIQEDGSA